MSNANDFIVILLETHLIDDLYCIHGIVEPSIYVVAVLAEKQMI